MFAAVAAAVLCCAVPSDSFTVAGAPFADSLTVQVHLPPGYDPARRYPVLYAFMTGVYFERTGLPAAADSATAAGLPPMIVVGLPDVDSWDVSRPGTADVAAYQRLVIERVLPEVEARYAASPRAADRWLLGFSAGANTVLDLAVHHPDRFGRVALQSPGWMVIHRDGRPGIGAEFTADALASIAAAPAAEVRPAVWLMWGDSNEEEWERRSRENGARVIAALRARGFEVAEPVLVPGGHELRLVPASLGAALRFLHGGAP